MTVKRETRVAMVLLPLVVVFLGWMFLAPVFQARREAQPSSGTIESIGTMEGGRRAAGLRVARVRLDDGRVISAFAVSGGPYSVGDRVRLAPSLSGIYPLSVVARQDRSAGTDRSEGTPEQP